MKNADLLVDLQWGSTGKGQVAGWLASQTQPDGRTGPYNTAISVNMPNAGHTYIDRQDRGFVNHILPSSANTQAVRRALLGPGSVFDIDQLRKEVIAVLDAMPGKNFNVFIHENAWVLTDEHRRMESMQELGSTRQGSGAARICKIARGNGLEVDNAAYHREAIESYPNLYVISAMDWTTLLKEAEGRILLEGSQGYGLGVDAGFYPYTTSRNCTPASFLNEAAVPISMLDQTYGVMRVHPIRVGGDSGPWYPGQEEMTWEDLEQVPEKTTTTGKIRRVANFSFWQIQEAMFYCEADAVFLTHCDYDPIQGDSIAEWFNASFPGSRIYARSYGPLYADMRPDWWK